MSAAKTWKLGLLGVSLDHSLSPAIHHQTLRQTGLDGVYQLIQTTTAELGAQVDALRQGAMDGLNVTLPFKEAVLGYCDSLEPMAQALGAVNTLTRADGGVQGHNTDVGGLERALLERWPTGPWRGRPCVVQGAGGAARAAVLAAQRVGVGSIRVVNRHAPRARSLVSDLQGLLDVELSAHEGPEAYQDVALVLQASSMGQEPSDAGAVEAYAKGVLARVAEGCAVFDLVYHPSPSPFVLGALHLGLAATGGYAMLVHQALLAFSLWTGQACPASAIQLPAVGR